MTRNTSTAQEATTAVARDNKARVSFAPGRTDAYIIVKGDHEEPYPGDCRHVYEDLDEAQRRAEWLNWSNGAKQAGKYHHPREEALDKRMQARAQLIEAHRALREQERFGLSIATQLAAFRAERAEEERTAQQLELKASQDSRSAKERKELAREAQKARKRAEDLSKRIARLEATPPLPSRLATKKEKEDDVRGRQEAAVPAGTPDDEPGGPAQAAS